MYQLFKDSWPYLLGLLVAALIGLVIYDYAAGSTQVERRIVRAKELRPAWTEIKTEHVPATTEKAAYMKTTTVRHPAEYRLYTELGDAVSVDARNFHTAREGEPLIIHRKVGRITGIHYPWTLLSLQAQLE